MPAPASTSEFVELVRKSGVADPGKLTAYLDRLAAAKKAPAEPIKLAGLLVRDGLLTVFQAEQLLQGKWKRFTIGKYRVLERLGSGGMGQVFLCEHKLMRRRVAVKVLPAAKATDAASLDRFYREARAVAALDHPNLVRAYDIDHDEGLHFLVMEYVDGTNLHDLVTKFGPLDVLRACHYVYGAAVGLRYANETGIVHRDIKPGNILVDRTGVVKILDMGLARFFNDEDDSLTRKYDETVLGTADYLAPEQAVDSHTVDIRADLYSLGGTFYFLLTGSPPFADGTIAQKLLWHQTRDPKPVRERRPDVPAEIADIVARLMVKDPALRVQTPEELMAMLHPWVQTPIPPPPDKEMPHLSLAAGGVPAASRPASGVLLAGGTPFGGGVSSSNSGIPAAAYPTPSGSGANGLPTIPSAGAGLWEAIAAAERPAAGDTAPRRSGSTVDAWPRPKVVSAPKRDRRKLLAVAGGAAGLLALAGLVWAFAFRDPKPKGGDQPAGPRRLLVTKGAADGEAFPTIAAALAKAAPGDTIALLDARIEESVLIGPRMKDKLKGVTIEGGTPGTPAVWAAPAAMPAGRAVFAVSGVDGLTVQNVLFDGGGRADVAVQVAGSAAGVTFEDVTARGARVAAVRLDRAAGESGRPLTFTRVRVVADGGPAGVLLAGKSRAPNAHVAFADCRFEGPGAAAVQIDGPTTDVEFVRCRAFNAESGFVLSDLGADDAVGVSVSSCTLHTLAVAGLHFDAPPVKGEFAVRQTYFAKTPVVAKAAKPAPAVKAKDNARDAAAADRGAVTLGAVVVDDARIPPPNPDDDATFLRPPAGGPLAAVGPGKATVGVPPR